jgi:putative methanogen marker protein 4
MRVPMQKKTDGLLDIIRTRALDNCPRVALGVRNPTPKLIQSAEKAQVEGYAGVVLVGNQREISAIGTNLEVIDTPQPEKVLSSLLASGDVDAAVRGTAKASGTLSHLKEVLGIEKLYRVAFLLTHDNNLFFLAPVGIDEGHSLSDKIELVQRSAAYIRRFGIEPEIGILSGGRMGDLGRDERVDRTLADADFLANRLNDAGIDAKHYTILIEDAIRKSNFILAPDGISGNLIFRSLVFLGGGNGIGAPVLLDKHVFIDTSRAGGHYTLAIMLAASLVSNKKEVV